MLNKIVTRFSKLSYFCTKKGMLALNDSKICEQVLQVRNDKLDALVQVIKSLNNIELKYLNILQNENMVEQEIKNNRIIATKQYSLLEYCYQERWKQQNWAQLHMLSVLVSKDEASQQEVKKEVEKEIYEFQLSLVDPNQKIKVIKTLRELLSVGLKQAKEFVDKAPIIFKQGSKEEGNKIKIDLQKLGCIITLK